MKTHFLVLLLLSLMPATMMAQKAGGEIKRGNTTTTKVDEPKSTNDKAPVSSDDKAPVSSNSNTQRNTNSQRAKKNISKIADKYRYEDYQGSSSATGSSQNQAPVNEATPSHDQSNKMVVAKTLSYGRPIDATFTYVYQGVELQCKSESGTVTIVGFDDKASTVVIPSHVQYNGANYIVEKVVPYERGHKYNTQEVIIEEGIESIGYGAFWEFSMLKSVTIPNSVTEIERRAFPNRPGIEYHKPGDIKLSDLASGKKIKR